MLLPVYLQYYNAKYILFIQLRMSPKEVFRDWINKTYQILLTQLYIFFVLDNS